VLALDNGFQACLMAPTEILANQHFIGLSELANELNINIKYLQVQPRHLLEKSFMKSWKTVQLIGTHALHKVKFQNLGLRD
jgi:ATP-dependent DNA helicase RecG